MLEKDILDVAFDGENKRGVGHLNPVFEYDATDSEPEKQNDGYKSKENINISEKTVQDSLSEQDLPTKRMIWKNLLVISLGFFFNFTAFGALSYIQSSLNSDQGLGLASLSVIYGSLVLSCMFVPSALIKRFGCKWAMVMSMLMYSTYIAANFYATWYTLIPTSILLGMGAAPLWGAKCTYLTEIGHQYAEIVGESAETLIVRFFGVFFMIFQSGQAFGNLISSLALAPASTNENYTAHLGLCGANYCNEDLTRTVLADNSTNSTDFGNINKPAVSQIYTLCGIYLGCSIFACVLISLFVSPLKRVKTITENIAGMKLLMATFRQMRNSKQLLLIPLTIFSGVEQAFIAGDFTKAFVNCALGIHNVGYVMICLGFVDSVCSFAFGPLVKILGRPFLYMLGATINIAMAITMLHWQPDPYTPVIFFVIAGFWGMADAIWQTQINAFYGVLFSNNSEAAFANYRLWESIGFIIGFLWSNYLCIAIKIYIMLTILIVGMVGYAIIEITIFLENKAEDVSDSKM